MSDRTILAKYKSDRNFRAALAAAPDETKLEYLALLKMALESSKKRYAENFPKKDIMGAQIDDTIVLLLRREIRDVERQLGFDIHPFG